MLIQFFYGFRRHVRHFLGCILSLFRPSLPLCFPVQEPRFGTRRSSSKSSSSSSSRGSSSRSRSSAAATTKVAAEQLTARSSRSRAAGRPCGQVAKSCPELEICVFFVCFLTRVSEGTLGLVDYHCRAPFRPSVPWCFPVREVHFLRQFVG